MAKPQEKRKVLLGTAAVLVGVIIVITVAVGLRNLRSVYLVSDRGKLSMPRVVKQTEVRIADLPALAEAIARGSAPVRYATQIFSTPDHPSDQDALNIQMSFENGKLGFDWVLLGPRNIEDQEKFKTFAHAYGVEPVARSQNGVSYLRLEDTDVAKFTASVVTDMYHQPANEPLGLVYEGFEWPPSDLASLAGRG